VLKSKKRQINKMEKFDLERIFYESAFFVKQFLNQSMEDRKIFTDEMDENILAIKQYL